MAEELVAKEMCRERHCALEKGSQELSRQLKEHEDKLRASDVRFSELSGDVKHIKNRIDNGLSRTICQIKERMEELVPLVRENAEWTGRVKQTIYYIVVTCTAGGIIGLVFYTAGLFIKRWVFK